MADRQEIMDINRSLRNVKNDLEKLLEKNVLSDGVFDSIIRQLPAEVSLSSASARIPAVRTASSPQPPTTGLNTTNPASSSEPPPAYSQKGPPALPVRNPVASSPPQKPVLAQARALYRYVTDEPRDVALEKDDLVDVHEYVNEDWWMGKNSRTGQEGLFPSNHVCKLEKSEKAVFPPPASAEATATLGNVGRPVTQRLQTNGEGGSKLDGQGKKFGKKLGNAAIFGAGATLGSKIVNTIF